MNKYRIVEYMDGTCIIQRFIGYKFRSPLWEQVAPTGPGTAESRFGNLETAEIWLAGTKSNKEQLSIRNTVKRIIE